MDKNNAGMVVCGGDTLCVFGGHGFDTGQRQRGATYYTEGANCWTNELHIFNIIEG